MKIKYVCLILVVFFGTAYPSERVDVFGCFAFQELLVDLFSEAAKDYFWFPNCLPGGFWDKIQCSIGKCYCAYVDTGSQIPQTIENEDYERMNTKCPVLLSTDSDPCKEKQTNLPCIDPSTKYVYDPVKATCARISGICHGFESYSACSRKCLNEKLDRCSFERGFGASCQYQSPSTRFHHNSVTKKCRPFKYKGCGGNSNNYNSKWECLRQCEGGDEETTLITVDGTQYSAVMPTWLVLRENFVPDVNNDITGQKYKDIENFIARLTTIKTKGHPNVDPPAYAKEGDTPQEVCSLEAETGPCRALFHRWYYNKKADKCEQFVYGGCLPNANNFKNSRHCQDYCRPANRLSPEEEVSAESVARGLQEEIKFESEAASASFTFD